MPALLERSDSSIEPFWSTTDGETIRLYHGDALAVLKQLPAKSVQMVVTSPPYWGLRDYKTDKSLEIGAEGTPQEYVERMVAVFRAVWRALRDDGTIWLNLGDSYSGGGGYWPDAPSAIAGSKQTTMASKIGAKPKIDLPAGNLIGIPWCVALALQADGWVLRQDIIWAKPSPMPESVKNRCTKAHEYVFLLTKSTDYYYDAEAIKEPAGIYERTRNNGERWDETKAASGALCAGSDGRANKRSVWTADDEVALGQWLEGNGPKALARFLADAENRKDVWRISSQGYPGAHFATFPPRLIEPMILAGTSEKGCCAGCGAPYRRVVEETKLTRKRPNDYVKRMGEEGTGNSCSNSVAGVEVKTLGWESGCDCGTKVVPCTVLDLFIGSGTTAIVCLDNGRRCIGIDLSEKYLTSNCIPRIEGRLLSMNRGDLAGASAESVSIGEAV